jgi:hypothetical protein
LRTETDNGELTDDWYVTCALISERMNCDR